MKKLDNGIPDPRHTLLFTDEYEYTSGDVDLQVGFTNEIVESYYFRKLMPNRGFHIFCGLEHFLAFVENFNDKTIVVETLIEWLESLNRYSPKFLDYLANYQFRGKIYSVPEGTIVFPNEHLLDVRGDPIFTQIIESELLSILNSCSSVASEAQACRLVAGERPIAEFGYRRSKHPLRTTRSAYIGGVDSTSNLYAGYRYGIPVSGTMPHKFIQERTGDFCDFFVSEESAFEEFAIHKPDNFTALVDTFNTDEGIKNAIRVSKNMQVPLKGIRLDSGDMVKLSLKAKRLLKLDPLGSFDDTMVIASDGLTPEKIQMYDNEGAKIDAFGIGTSIVQANMSGVYKLVETGGQPSMKFTDNPEKMSQPCHTQIWRIWNSKDIMKCDIITKFDEHMGDGYMDENDTCALLKEEVFDGYSNTIEEDQTIDNIRNYVKWQVKRLPKGIARIGSGIPKYPIYRTQELVDIQKELIARWKEENNIKPNNTTKTTMIVIMKTIEDRLKYNMGKAIE